MKRTGANRRHWCRWAHKARKGVPAHRTCGTARTNGTLPGPLAQLERQGQMEQLARQGQTAPQEQRAQPEPLVPQALQGANGAGMGPTDLLDVKSYLLINKSVL